MKMKTIATLASLFLSAATAFALDKQRVFVHQLCQRPGGLYTELTTPQLPTGTINLRYEFTVDAKDDEHAVIDCVARFPIGLNIRLTSCNGIQALETDSNELMPVITTYTKSGCRCFEFLISQKAHGSGYVEFQADIEEAFAGTDIPARFDFSHFQKPLFMRWGAGISLAAGVAAGAVAGVVTMNPAIGVGVGLVVAGTGTAVSYTTTKETLQEMREKYNEQPMNDSYTQFVLQVRR